MDKLQAELGELRKRADQLTTKRAKAQIALDATMADRQRHLLDGDLDDEKTRCKLQAAVDTAASAPAGFDDAIKERPRLSPTLMPSSPKRVRRPSARPPAKNWPLESGKLMKR